MSDFEEKTPDTSTNDEIENEEGGGFIPPAIPVAEPDPEPAAAAAPPGPAYIPPPRPYPQHFKLLLSNALIVVGCCTLWERAHVGSDVLGYHTVGGALVLGFGFYSLLATLVCMMRGGVNMFGSLLTSTLALYFAIRHAVATTGLDGFEYFGDLKEAHGFQEGVNKMIGQFGPGLWLCAFGGLVVYWLFVKAMFGGGKKEEEQAASSRRRRR